MPELRSKPVNLENKTVRRILAAALACWARDGYHGASLKDIADEAGVAKSLLHYHFESKEHLLIELQAVHSHKTAAAVRERLAGRQPSVESALAALDDVFEAAVAVRDQFPFALEVWRASLKNSAVRARLEDFEREILALLEEGIVASLGPLVDRLRLPPDRLAELLKVALGGFQLSLFLSGDVERVRRVFEDFKAVVRLAVLPPAGEGRAS